MKRVYSVILFLPVILSCTAIPPLGASSGATVPVFLQTQITKSVSHPTDKAATKGSDIRIGIISYWEASSAAWDRVPADSLVLINPNDGILETNGNQPVQNSSAWIQLVDRLRKKSIVVLGYVPTGYFDRGPCKKDSQPKCQPEARIRLQVKTYYQLIPSLAGIFYDETSPKEGLPDDYNKEYGLLRSMNLPGRITVFNVGWPSDAAVKATRAGEHLVLYESSPYKYQKNADAITALTRSARDKNIIVWHLIHSACREDLRSYVAQMAERCANYGYVTNVGGDWEAGENTWGSLPPYWDEELAAFSAAGKACAKK